MWRDMFLETRREEVPAWDPDSCCLSGWQPRAFLGQASVVAAAPWPWLLADLSRVTPGTVMSTHAG